MIAVSRVSVYAFASFSAFATEPVTVSAPSRVSKRPSNAVSALALVDASVDTIPSAYVFASASAWSAYAFAAAALTTSFASADAIASACALATDPVPEPSIVSKRPPNAVSAEARVVISVPSAESLVVSTELTNVTISANVSLSALDADKIASMRPFCTSEYD